MTPVTVRRHPITLLPENARVIIRPFIPADGKRIAAIIGRALALSEEEADQELRAVCAEFDARHLDINAALTRQFEHVRAHTGDSGPLSAARQLLIGAMFSGEYALEASALFNPSIVPHPDQSDAPAGGLKFIMSLRATGEGHISSIEFRTGLISGGGSIEIDPASGPVTMPDVVPNPKYFKQRFLIKLYEMGFDNDCTADVVNSLGEEFTRTDLSQSVASFRRDNKRISKDTSRTLDGMQWLADSNYEVQFPPDTALSERVIFPVSNNESNGIEDARFVRFRDDDGTVTYCATYTAFNGQDILPQIIETEDFGRFRIVTLNGNAVQNKGMALFPRRVNGHYVMLSRQDDENLFIMQSDMLHYWNDPQIVLRPEESWESVKIGNCGSPVETEAGWLVITHGVGPMRKYCIGAALLDLDDPGRVIGRLREPLLAPAANERDGYVPNVVYSCGALVHDNTLILPYAMSDHATSIVSVPLDNLLAELTR